jgi:hypothetical protein
MKGKWCALLIAAWLFQGLAASQERVQVEFKASIEKVGSDAKINWGGGYIEARGEGVYPDTPNRAQARLMARRAAIVDAQRNLLEAVQGVRVTAETKVKNFTLVSDEVKTEVEGFIKNAVVITERDKGDSYEVVMRVPFNGIAATLLQAVKEPERYDIPEQKVQSWDPPQAKVYIPSNPPTEPAPPSNLTTDASKPYTGVIIDARGLGMRPCMSPKIRRENGSEVWGTLQVAPEVALEYGIAAWLRDTKDLEHPLIRKRLGDNPMFIRAIGVAGAGKGDAVLKAEDAQRLLEENQRGGDFLGKLAVVFLY